MLPKENTSPPFRPLTMYERFLQWLIDRLDNHLVKVSEKAWERHNNPKHDRYGW